MNLVQGILYVLLCWVCRLIKSERVSRLCLVQEDFVKRVY